MSIANFLYHTEAVGASGSITLPVADTMPLQASVASAIGTGFGKARVDNFKHLDYLSIGSMESQVVSSFSAKDNAYGTLASVVVEDLNNLNVVTCKRIVSRLTGKHDAHDELGSSPGSFMLHGTHFDGLLIAGHTIEIDLSGVGLFSELSTWEKLNEAWESDLNLRKELNLLRMHPLDPAHLPAQLPARNGVFACTLATFPDKLPRGITRKNHGIYIPHYGTVYLAEYFITATSRRLRMMHIDLGCSVEGCNGIGNSGSNGQGVPNN